MPRPYHENWLFDGNDPDDFWAAEPFPCDEAYLEFLEGVTAPSEEGTGWFLHTAPVGHLVSTRRALVPGKVTHPEMQDRYMTRWAVHHGYVILNLEFTDEAGEERSVRVARIDRLAEDPEGAAISIEAVPNQDDGPGKWGHNAVNIGVLSVKDASEALAAAVPGDRVLIPKRRFEHFVFVVLGDSTICVNDALEREGEASALRSAGVTAEVSDGAFQVSGPYQDIVEATPGVIEYMATYTPVGG